MQKPFWEETYKYDDIFAFGPEPNVSLTETEKFLNVSDNIIDTGCGDGHNVLYLARQGYQKDEHLNVPKHLHASNKIVARRLK